MANSVYDQYSSGKRVYPSARLDGLVLKTVALRLS